MDAAHTQPSRSGRADPRLAICAAAALAFTAWAAAGCGQVITVTPTPPPTATATIEVAILATPDEPTATPAPYTPAPTATPTLTPTPIIHTIQAGESLLAIANLYAISVASLQEANGILDPRTLQIGQQLIIPEEEEAEENAVATATATPLPMEVENVHLSETATGGLWVLGEAYNAGNTPLEQVRVGVTLLDAQGNEIGHDGNLVALDLVDAGERAPFAILFTELPAPPDQFRAYVLSAVPAYVGSYYRDLEVQNLETISERYATYTVTGQVFNTGPEEAVDVQVVLTAYDPLGRVVAMQAITPDYNVVPRGGNTTFTAILAPVGGPVTRVAAEAQGRRQSAAP